VVFPSAVSPGEEPETPAHDERQARLAEARRVGDFELALEIARETASTADRAWRVADARRAVKTLERIVTLDAAARSRIAEADRLAPVRLDHERHCRTGEALSVARKRLAIYREILGRNHVETVPSLVAIARNNDHEETGDSDAVLDEARSIALQEFGADHPLVADVLAARSKLRFDEADYGASEGLAREALQLRRALLGPRHPDLVESLTFAAQVDNRNRDVGGAEAAAREALAMSLQIHGEAHAATVRATWALAKSLTLGGRYAEAERHLREALDLYGRTDDICSIPKTAILTDLAQLYYHQGDVDEALEALLEIRSLKQAAGESTDDLLNNLGVLFHRLGDYAAAASHYRQALERSTLPPGSHDRLIQQCNLARALTDLGKFDEARALLDDTLESAIADGTESMDRVLTTVMYYSAILYDRRGKYAEAESELMKRLGLLQELVGDQHNNTVRSYRLLGEARVGKGDLSAALEAFEKAAGLFEGARRKAGSDLRAATFEMTPYEQLALTRLEIEPGEEAWRDVERARGRLLADKLLAGVFPLPLDRVRAALSPDAAIVGWIDHELRPGQPRAWAYLIRSEGPVRWIRLDAAARPASREGLRTIADLLIEPGLSAFGTGGRSAELKAAAGQAWADRLAPLIPHLEGIETLTVVPSGLMSGVPLETLVDEEGDYLGDRYSVSYAVSASLHARLAEAARPQRTARRALLVGDPVYGGSGAADKSTARRTLRDAVLGDDVALARLPRLRWSGREVRDLARVLPSSKVLVRADASARELTRLAHSGGLQQFDVVHLATHALVDNRDPQRSALVLSGDGEQNTSARLITAGEIAGTWQLGAELVTLSACETALGRDIFGEGIVGFAYPLLQVGARSVLLSLWKVDDEATSLLMRRFYEAWMGEAGDGPRRRPARAKAEALRVAKRWLREYEIDGRRPYEHPYFWSGFVLIGNPR
jgi:CHAT domain-containing protein/tetratricopeptide (TPR) repeat protein